MTDELLADLAAAWDGGDGETSAANERLFAEIGFAASLSGSSARPAAVLDAPPAKSFAASSAPRSPATPAPKRATPHKPTPKPPRSRLGTLWLAACLLIAAFFGYQAVQDATAKLATLPITPVSHISPAAAEPQLVGRPIEEIQVGERMYVEEGYGEEDYSLGADVDPATWRKLTLRVPKQDGGHVDVELLRPLDWIDAHGAEAGYTFEISLQEMGVEGPAYVVDIAPCPPVRDGPGRVVTGTFHHSSAETLDLYIEGVEPIGVTANHPFWSEDRRAFVPAGELQPGEQVRTLSGTPRVIRTVPRSGREAVYNLEIQVDHIYHVSAHGVLVHNTYPKAKVRPRGKASLRARLGEPPARLKKPQAHHDLPHTFREKFEATGLDIEDAAHGRWVEGGPVGDHQKWSGEFEGEWAAFFKENSEPTRRQVLNFMDKLRKDPRFQ